MYAHSMFVELQGPVNGITAAFHALDFLVLTRFSFVVVITMNVQSLHIHSLVTVKFTMIIVKGAEPLCQWRSEVA